MVVSTLVLATSCSNDDTVEPKHFTIDECPQWKAGTDYLPYTAQLIDIDCATLPAEVSEDDLLAAFIGDECRDVTTPYMDNEKWYADLMVGIHESEESTAGLMVVLKYYSAKESHIYTSEAFPYVGDDIMVVTDKNQIKWKD